MLGRGALKEQLRLLLHLQSIDAKCRELDAQIKILPAKLEPARRDLAKLEAMLNAEKARLLETETWKRQQETLHERESDAFRAAKTKLNSSRTGKEFNAATREMDNKKRGILEREAEIKKVSEAVVTTSAQVLAHEADVEQIRASLAADEAEVAGRVAVLREEITTISAGRDELRAQITPSLLKSYDAIGGKRGYGFGIAKVVKGVCQGCHTALPPQLNNILARGESVETCPRCSRIIYRQEMIEDKPEDAAAAGSPEAS